MVDDVVMFGGDIASLGFVKGFFGAPFFVEDEMFYRRREPWSGAEMPGFDERR